MTEHDGTRSHHTSSGRLDLRVLDADDDARRTERVIRAVMEQIPARAQAPEIVRTLARVRFGMAAAAMVLATLATALVLAARRQDPTSAAELLERWAESNHVPTNGELLTAYQGYRP